MQPLPPPRHPDLAALRERVLRMGGRVEDMVTRALRALGSRDVPLARAVIALDDRVDAAEVDIDRHCLRVLERVRPEGVDLRLVTFAIKATVDLERIADLATNLACVAVDLADDGLPDPWVELHDMGGRVVSMLERAIDAFNTEDADLARRVIADDDLLDDWHHAFLRARLAEASDATDPAVRTRAIRGQSASRYIERMGDHCTNLAEKVIFLVEGEVVVHKVVAQAGK